MANLRPPPYTTGTRSSRLCLLDGTHWADPGLLVGLEVGVGRVQRFCKLEVHKRPHCEQKPGCFVYTYLVWLWSNEQGLRVLFSGGKFNHSQMLEFNSINKITLKFNEILLGEWHEPEKCYFVNLPMLVSWQCLRASWEWQPSGWDTCDLWVMWALWGAGCTDILHCARCSGSLGWYLSKCTWCAATYVSCPELAPRLCQEKSRSALFMIPGGCTAWSSSSSTARAISARASAAFLHCKARSLTSADLNLAKASLDITPSLAAWWPARLEIS